MTRRVKNVGDLHAIALRGEEASGKKNGRPRGRPFDRWVANTVSYVDRMVSRSVPRGRSPVTRSHASRTASLMFSQVD
jgi:hypothetical protein